MSTKIVRITSLTIASTCDVVLGDRSGGMLHSEFFFEAIECTPKRFKSVALEKRVQLVCFLRLHRVGNLSCSEHLLKHLRSLAILSPRKKGRRSGIFDFGGWVHCHSVCVGEECTTKWVEWVSHLEYNGHVGASQLKKWEENEIEELREIIVFRSNSTYVYTEFAQESEIRFQESDPKKCGKADWRDGI